MKHLPSKQELTIAGQRLCYTLAGEGEGPVIVLINGSGGPLEAWYKLYPQIAQLGSRVLAYDRPGVGGSAKPTTPQTGAAAVALLRGLLGALALPGPYLLLGHSFGGLHANLFARLHPEEVMGVVLLEATAPADVGSMREHQTAAQRAVNRLLNLFSRPDPNDEVSQERQTVAQIAAAPPFPAVPLRVITGAKTLPGWMTSAAALDLRRRHQQGLLALSPQGVQLLAERSGHFPQMSEPALVIEAVAQVLSAGVPSSQGVLHAIR
ncbi:alpha/beta fold hydrolase [Paucibacter sp. XJ19-41]|uniref:alpha/beta fold hydrolase n=1 Tax=Paucibacter sp. XJ19-41 TaxID=2927824 RepID=UPI00234AFDDB|nr:alpha/beta fold hydrolase [Paucibacter sp. XJ19-41]MDC6168846.1 alpha/beta fold hydrolase [Paucibacter sp. XJ19-41]